MSETMSSLKANGYTGKLESDLGRTWFPRREAADRAHQMHSRNWEYYRALYLSVYEGMEEIASWSDKVAYGWSFINAMVDDTYFQNPETLATSTKGDPHGDEAKIATDVINSAHRQTDTEGHVRQGMQASAWAGFGLHWSYFEHKDHEEPVYETNPDTGVTLEMEGKPVQSVDGAGQPKTKIVVDSQAVCGEYVSPWLYRGDPEGRRWDFKDFRWVSRRYRLSLGAALRSSVYHDTGKAMLKAWATQRPQTDAVASQRDQTLIEEDPNFVSIDMEEVWSRPDQKIIHFPVGANFDAGVGDWPQEFVDSDEVPYTLVAFNKVPENKDFTEGWWAKPDIELIAEQLEQLNRLSKILMEAATLSSLKYLFIKGLISEEEWVKIESDKSRTGIPIDLTKVIEHLRAAGIAVNSDLLDVRKLWDPLESTCRHASLSIL